MINWQETPQKYRKIETSLCRPHEKGVEYADHRIKTHIQSSENQKIVGLIGSSGLTQVTTDCCLRWIGYRLWLSPGTKWVPKKAYLIGSSLIDDWH